MFARNTKVSGCLSSGNSLGLKNNACNPQFTISQQIVLFKAEYDFFIREQP